MTPWNLKFAYVSKYWWIIYHMKAIIETKLMVLLVTYYVVYLQKYGYLNFLTPDRLLTKPVSRDQQRCDSNKSSFLSCSDNIEEKSNRFQ